MWWTLASLSSSISNTQAKRVNSSKHVVPGVPGEASRCRRWQQSESTSLIFIMKTKGVRKRWKQRENLKQASRRPQGRGGLQSSWSSRNYWRAPRNKGNAAGKQRRCGARRKRRALGERDIGIRARSKGKLAARSCWLLSSALLNTFDQTCCQVTALVLNMWSFQLCQWRVFWRKNSSMFLNYFTSNSLKRFWVECKVKSSSVAM